MKSMSWILFSRHFGAAALGSVLFLGIQSCGKVTDAEATKVDELKFPGALNITDNGDGSALLAWAGSNNEDDFDGYNIYGMKGSALTLGVTEGKPLELLDDKGEPIAASKKILENFNYDPANGLTAKGNAPEDKGDKDFYFLPIHQLDSDKKPLLPTCKPSGTNGITCEATTTANKSKKGTDVALNGVTTYKVSNLLPGETYCFLVLSSMKEGKSVSQTSSNAACITPGYPKTIAFPMNGNGEKYSFKLRDYLTACTTATSGSCPDLSSTYYESQTSAANSSSTEPLYVETYNTGTDVFLVAGKNGAINDLGYYADGFTDSNLPDIPALTIDSNGLQNSNGYSLSGQSVILKARHLYVVAVADKDATSPTKFRYHQIYVNSDTDPVETDATLPFVLRLMKSEQ